METFGRRTGIEAELRYNAFQEQTLAKTVGALDVRKMRKKT